MSEEENKKIIVQEEINQSYYPQIWELLVPSPDIFYTLNSSEDKTSLFMISLCRILIYIYILKIVYNFVGSVIFYMLVTIIVINCVYLLGVMIKKPQNVVIL